MICVDQLSGEVVRRSQNRKRLVFVPGVMPTSMLDKEKDEDPESQLLINTQSQLQQKAVEDAAAKEASPRVQFWVLSIWMINNILVTLLNKMVFASVDFKYPYTLSAVHMACNIFGVQIYYLIWRNTKPKVLDRSQWRKVIMFSIIFALNIAIGNTSLRWVSVAFNQVARALVPVLTMAISMLLFRKDYSGARKWAVLPIVLGVALAFYGDMSYTAIGVFYTAACVVLAALKAVVGGELLTGDLKLNEMDLLNKMCPLALVWIGLAAIGTGEIGAIMGRWEELALSSAPQVVLLTGVLSFSLNVSSFVANKNTSALTLCIAANLKQVVVVGCGSLFLGEDIPLLNGIGILIVVIGSVVYGKISIDEKSSGN